MSYQDQGQGRLSKAGPKGSPQLSGRNDDGGRRLGLSENWFQFSIFTILTLLIGMTIGIERVALPPLAHKAFGVTSILYTVSFVSGFGVVKAVMNLVSGRLSDSHGRKSLLALGWLFIIPFALLIIFAQAWWWVVLANLFLGVNQGLTWTMSVTSKIDLVGPQNRGLAVGIDESAGYVGVGAGGILAGILVARFGLRPAPYLVVLAVMLLGLILTVLVAKETLPWAAQEASQLDSESQGKSSKPRLLQLASYMSWHDRTMFSVCQAGFLNKFADSLVIGFFPIYFLRKGETVAGVGMLVGVYALVWGFSQVATGILADRIGRKWPIAAGILLVGLGILMIALTGTTIEWLAGAVLMGLGMALAYPNLISAVSDVAQPSWRGGALGIYRLWRDGGYAVGPLFLGGIATLAGLSAALWASVILMFVSALIVVFVFRETEPTHRSSLRQWEVHPELILPKD